MIKGPLKPNFLPNIRYLKLFLRIWVYFQIMKSCISPRSGKTWEEFEKKNFWLGYQYRNWTLVSVPDTKTWFWSYTTGYPLPADFHTFLQPEVDLAKKLTGAATAASQLLVCKHHWQLYGAGKSLLQSSKFWAKKTLIHWHPSFSFDFAMAGWLYFLVFVAKFLASTILYVKCEKNNW